MRETVRRMAPPRGFRLARWTALLLAVPSASDGFVQVSPKKDIVVRGRSETAEKQARRFVRQVTTAREGQLSRFADPICPVAAGLSPESNEAIVARLRLVADAAAIRQAGAQCAPNIVLIVARDADAFVASVRTRFPAMLGNLSPAEMKQVLRGGPVHAWSTIEVQNEDGEPISGVTDDGTKILNVRRASRILEPTQQVVLRSVLVIDAQALAGKTLTQVADYAAMRTLAGARPPEDEGGSETILRLFDGAGATPPALTPTDRGYLRGLYRTHPNRRAMTEVNRISSTIVKETTSAN